MRRPTVAAGVVAGLRSYIAARGVDADAIVLAADIDVSTLDDPDARIALARYLTLMRLASHALDDPVLALHYGAHVPMAEVSILGLIMEASTTMAGALHQLQRYGSLALELEDGRDEPALRLQHAAGRLLLVDTRPLDTPRELIDEAFARLVCGPRRFLSQPHVLAVHFTAPDLEHHAEYERVLGCPVMVGATANMLELHPGVADWPVAQHPPYVSALLTARADELLDVPEAPQHYRDRVELEVRARLHEGEVSATSIAERLHCSRSTLYRQLNAEGTSLTRIVDQVRRDLALEHMAKRTSSVRQVAYLTGFSDPAAFSRAFRRWSGESPSAYRDRTGSP